MRLRDPEWGTVIRVGEDQSRRYLARGWVDADAKPEPSRVQVSKHSRRK